MASVQVRLLSIAVGLVVGALAALPPSAHATVPSQQAGDLAPGAGPVMHKVAVYTIFWLPQGMSYEPSNSSSSDEDYEGFVNNFFLDVGGSPWYGTLAQYGDKKGKIQNNVKLVDSVVDTRPYPNGRGTTSSALLDSDIHQEIVREIKARHWTNQKLVSHFFVFSALDVPSNDKNCGYHSDFTYKKQPVIFTFAADLPTTCDPNVDDLTTADNAPSGDPAADIQINNVAHELAEASTDPLGDGWAANGDYEKGEIADVCDSAMPPRDGNGGDISFSNRDHFYVQTLYSNQDGGCVLDPGGDIVPTQPSSLVRVLAAGYPS